MFGTFSFALLSASNLIDECGFLQSSNTQDMNKMILRVSDPK